MGRLEIKGKGLKRKMNSLFKQISEDKKLEKDFINNPYGYLSGLSTPAKKSGTAKKRTSYLKAKKTREVSEINRLLYSILANKKFLNWMDSYAKKNKGKRADKTKTRRDFADAIIKYGDKNLLGSVASITSAGIIIPGLGDVAQQFLINNAAKQMTFSEVCSEANCSQKVESSTNLESNSSTNGIGFGTLSRTITPAFMRSVIEQLIKRGKALSKAGKLADLNQNIY